MRPRALITMAACPNLPVKWAVYPVLLCSNNARQMLRHRQRRPAPCANSLKCLRTQTRITAWLSPEVSLIRLCLDGPRMLRDTTVRQVRLASKLLPAVTRQPFPVNIPQRAYGEKQERLCSTNCKQNADIQSGKSQKLPIPLPLRSGQKA